LRLIVNRGRPPPSTFYAIGNGKPILGSMARCTPPLAANANAPPCKEPDAGSAFPHPIDETALFLGHSCIDGFRQARHIPCLQPDPSLSIAGTPAPMCGPHGAKESPL